MMISSGNPSLIKKCLQVLFLGFKRLSPKLVAIHNIPVLSSAKE